MNIPEGSVLSQWSILGRSQAVAQADSPTNLKHLKGENKKLPVREAPVVV